MKLTRGRMILLLILATLGAYANTLRNQFVWDDELLVKSNTYIRNASYVGAAFTSDLFHNHTVEVATHYRPLQTISLMVDYAFWGLNPVGYHLTNVLLHLACVILLVLLVEKLTGLRMLALVVAVFFAVHPVNTNAVAYISGRADSLAFLFLLSSLLLLVHYQHRKLPVTAAGTVMYSGSILCYVAALFSRESALLFPLIVLTVNLFLPQTEKRKIKDAFLAALPFAIVAVAFAFWRTEVLALQGKPIQATEGLPVVTRLQVFFRAIATYFGLLFWPAHLHMDRQLISNSFKEQLLTLSGVLAVGALGAWMRWTRSRVPFAFAGWCWFVVTLVPLAGLLNLNATMAEHWLYVPAVGFFIALVATAIHFEQNLPQRVPHLLPILCFLSVIALTARTIHRNTDWASPISLYSSTEQSAPLSAGTRANLGHEFAAAGQSAQALRELEIAERLQPRSARAKSNLAAFYLQHGNSEKARTYVDASLRLAPDDPVGLLQAAAVAETQGDLRRAHLNFIRAAGTTTDVQPRLQFGLFLLRRHQLPEALALVDECRRLEPGNANVFNLLGSILSENQDFDQAQKAFEIAHSLDRHATDADSNLARLACLRGDFATAEIHYRRVLLRQPGDALAHYRLGLVLWKRGDRSAAKEELKTAAWLLPTNPNIREALRRLSLGERFDAA